jgi:SAM-dependent methyltransferase
MTIAFHTAKGTASQPQFWPDYWRSVSVQLDSKYLPEYGVLMRHLAPGASVLDIGCGRGLLVRDLLQKGYKARGIDFDGQSIFDSVACAGHFPSEVGDLNHLPYQANSFDAILLAGTVEHVFGGPEGGFSEAFRVLKPGGHMVLTIPYINLVRKVALPFYLTRDLLFSYFPEARKKRFFEYVFTRSEVVGMLSRAGFTVMECDRAYYTTVLRKIPGVKRATEAVFGQARNSASNGVTKETPRPDDVSSPGIKRILKPIIEGTLNGIIPNRLIVVAQKPVREEWISMTAAQFNYEESWALKTGPVDAKESERIRQTLELITGDVRSVLDAVCGDGTVVPRRRATWVGELFQKPVAE